MSDDKYIKDEVNTIEEEDMVPNPPQVNGKLKYCLIACAILLAVISVLAVVFGSDGFKNETKPVSSAQTQYII